MARVGNGGSRWVTEVVTAGHVWDDQRAQPVPVYSDCVRTFTPTRRDDECGYDFDSAPQMTLTSHTPGWETRRLFYKFLINLYY